jgi:hypothetical protein
MLIPVPDLAVPGPWMVPVIVTRIVSGMRIVVTIFAHSVRPSPAAEAAPEIAAMATANPQKMPRPVPRTAIPGVVTFLLRAVVTAKPCSFAKLGS